MDEITNFTKKFIMVGMGDAMISTLDKPIIGTEALATCTGVLIYSKEEKRAIVAHVSSDYMKTIDKIFKLITINKLYRTPLKYKIIYGGDGGDAARYQGVIDALEKHFKEFPMEEFSELSLNGVKFNSNYFANEFAFNTLSGEFVTDKVLFGSLYYIINGNQYDISNINKTR